MFLCCVFRFTDDDIGLAKVERAFVHVDYEDEHNTEDEHRPLYEKPVPSVSVSERIKARFTRNGKAVNKQYFVFAV